MLLHEKQPWSLSACRSHLWACFLPSFVLHRIFAWKQAVSQLLISTCWRQTLQRACFHANRLQKNRAHEHLPEPVCQPPCYGYPMCTETFSSFAHESCCVCGKHSLRDFQSIFHGRWVSFFKTMLRRSNCVGCNINQQPGKAPLACSILKLSTNVWHWQRGTINMRLRLLQKKPTTVTGGSSSALAPESSCDFYSFISILLLFQQTGYVEKPNQRREADSDLLWVS